MARSLGVPVGERQAAIAGPRWEAAAIIGRVSLSARLASGSRERSPGRKPSVSAREVTRGTDAKGGEGAGLRGTRAERPPPPAPAVCSVFVPRGWLHVTLGQQSSAARRGDAPDTGHRRGTQLPCGRRVSGTPHFCSLSPRWRS